jgi:hypothetical protein
MVAGEEAKWRDRNCAKQLPHLAIGELAFSVCFNDLATTLLLLSVVFSKWPLEVDWTVDYDTWLSDDMCLIRVGVEILAELLDGETQQSRPIINFRTIPGLLRSAYSLYLILTVYHSPPPPLRPTPYFLYFLLVLSILSSCHVKASSTGVLGLFSFLS